MDDQKHSNFQLLDFPFQHTVQTRWKDMDSFRHVNNANYLTYIEDARLSLFKRWGLGIEKKSLIVASIKIDYLYQLKHSCKLIIGQRISRIGNKSFDIESAIFNNNKVLAISLVVCVCYDYVNKVSLPVFPEIIADQE